MLGGRKVGMTAPRADASVALVQALAPNRPLHSSPRALQIDGCLPFSAGRCGVKRGEISGGWFS